MYLFAKQCPFDTLVEIVILTVKRERLVNVLTVIRMPTVQRDPCRKLLVSVDQTLPFLMHGLH